MFLINLTPISTGGGLQNALSLVSDFSDYSNCKFIVNKNSLLHEFCLSKDLNHIAVEQGYLSRLLFELSVRRYFKKGTVCFTLFGPPLLLSRKYLYNINGFAYSNILHKDIDFWWWCSPLERIKRKFIDFYRAKVSSWADEIIFETDLLLELAKKDARFNKRKLHVVHMAPSKLVSSYLGSEERNSGVDESLFNVLYLAGAHPNKRVSDLPKVAKVLLKNNIQLCFVTTLPDGLMLTNLNADAEALGVTEYFKNLGPVTQSKVGSLVNSVDAMINVAYLESFSNNVVEAWALSKPLIITDAEWARRSCGDAAIYIDIDDETSIVSSFKSLRNKNEQAHLISKGREMLNKMPTSETKHQKYMEIIKSAQKCLNQSS